MFELVFDRFGPYAFFPLFVGFWALISALISVWGGWRVLAHTYPAERKMAGETFRFESAQLRGGVNYNGCLTVTVDPRGLRLSVFFPFRVAHPPIYIPWSDITAKPRPRRWLPRVVFTFARCPGIPLVVSKGLAERMLEMAGRPGELAA